MPPSNIPRPAVLSTSTAPAIWLVRHGESIWNTLGLAQGHNDQATLTNRGLRQAEEAAQRFRGQAVGAIYASDLRRALQTAAVFGRVLHVDARLRERSLGVFEGTAAAAIGPEITGLGEGRVLDPDARPAGGESVRDLYLRAAAFCNDVGLTGGDAGPTGEAGPDVLVVAHGGTVRVLEAYLYGIDVEQMRWEPVGNATVVRVPRDRQPSKRPVHTQPRGGI
jgi:broad specificity phosphatase PhoE